MADTLKRLESLVEKNVALKDRKEAIRQAERYEAELDRLIRRRDDASKEVSYGQVDIDKWNETAIKLYTKAKMVQDDSRGEVKEVPLYNGMVEQFESFWTDCKLNFLDDDLMTEKKKIERLRRGVPEWFRPRLDNVDLKKAEKLLREEYLGKKRVWPALHAIFSKVPSKIGKNAKQLDQLAKAVEAAWRIVRAAPDGETLYKTEVFVMAYNRLSEDLCEAYRRETDQQHNLEVLLEFLGKEATRWVAHSMDRGSARVDKNRFSGAASRGVRFSKADGRCYNCGESGHKKINCKNPPKCFECNRTGHIAKNCLNKNTIKHYSRWKMNLAY